MTIIAAVDDDQATSAVITEAAKLASGLGNELHVLHVLTRSEFLSIERDSVENTGQGVAPSEIRERAEQRARTLVEEIDPEIDYTAVGAVGEPADELISYAEDRDADYIVVGGRNRSPVGKVLFGSVTQSVLLDSPCTVVTAMGRAQEE